MADRVGRDAKLKFARCGGDEDDAVDFVVEFVEFEGAVVEGGGEAKAVVDEVLLAGAVAVIHAADLGDGDVALVDKKQEVVGEVVDESAGRGALLAAGKVARVIFDAFDKAGGLEHFEVVFGALGEALGLEMAAAL